MIEAFGVKNLRCLTDTGLVELKPITLLVGRNSSGKSTFLRAFPLLRQSVESPRRSPIYWSHPTFVDFASLETAVNERNPEAGVTFSFRTQMSGGRTVGNPRCTFAMTLGAVGDSVVVRSWEAEIESTKIQCAFGTDGRVTNLTIDGADVLPSDGLWLSGPASLVPTLTTRLNGKQGYSVFVGEQPSYVFVPSSFGEPLVAALLGRFPSLNRGQAMQIELGARLGSVSDMTEWVRTNLHPAGVSALELESAFKELLPLIFFARLPEVLGHVDWALSGFASVVRYLGPQRAVGERQYPLTEVTVEEILPRGQNLPQFLARLDESQMNSLADFTREHLGFETSLRRQGLYIEILIKTAGSNQPKNIADVGFGYAEVLPLVTSLWWTFLRDDSRPTSVLALEQPELHLHPAHQARLARLFVSAITRAKKESRPGCLLIETHSEAVVNSLGKLVRQGLISADDLQILFFDQDPETRETKIQRATYKPNGGLQNWPFGFLAPIADEDLYPAADGA